MAAPRQADPDPDGSDNEGPRAREGEGIDLDAMDVAALDARIAELEVDLAEARAGGDLRAANEVRRLWLLATTRRAKVRPPPPPPPEGDALAHADGAACLLMIRRLIDAERGALAAPEETTCPTTSAPPIP